MRRLVESTFVTLDGVISSPQVWGPPYWDDEHAAYARDLLLAADALLLGRETYEAFSKAWPSRTGEYSRTAWWTSSTSGSSPSSPVAATACSTGSTRPT